MMSTAVFVLTAEHLKLLRSADVEWNFTGCGAPAISTKRPYGHSDVAANVCRLLGWNMEGDHGSGPCWSHEQHERAMSIHRGTKTALQIILLLGVWPAPGTYLKPNTYDTTPCEPDCARPDSGLTTA